MALVLHLKYAEGLRGKNERLAKVSFRGVAHYSRVVENTDDNVIFDEVFEWPVARPIESEEQVEIQLFNYNKYLSNRLVGTFRVVLQQLIEVGQLKVSDCLIDDNNVIMKVNVTFNLTYNAPDGSVGNWQKEPLIFTESPPQYDETRHLLGVDKSSDTDSIPSSPKSMHGSRHSSIKSSLSSIRPKSPKSPTKTVRSLKTIGKIIKLGKQRPVPDDEQGLVPGNQAENDQETSLMEERLVIAGHREDDSLTESQTSGAVITPGPTPKRTKPQQQQQLGLASHKAQDFQVCITVIEARQLAGLNMDPVVCVQVGEQKKYTSVKESTNCPYYNEYFVFDFHMAPAMLFDKIITLTVLQSRTIIRPSKLLGSFKLDTGTVYSHQDHQFYHKWAMLTDPDDINSGPKGYLKCDIAVIGKGDNIKAPPKTDKDEDDIEANLLLPDGVPAERQKARFIIKVYKAEGLPKMNTGLMANVKKAFTGEAKDLVDPYVLVSFAGHRGKTSVKRGAYEPCWNEQIVFTEMFPPLCRRLKIQLRDQDSVNDEIVGTHFLDLAKISNEGEKGFLPTFGPCWVNLYGSTRNYSLLEEHSHLNEGLGEGISYRGRILLALKTEILESQDLGPTTVEVESCLPVTDNTVGRMDDFFLFATVLEADMIDRKLSDKAVKFELSIGNCGNTLDGRNESVKSQTDSDDEDDALDDDDEDDVEKPAVEAEWHSVTNPSKPLTRDRFYYFMPYGEDKPCLWVKGTFEDHRRRMYNTNMMEKIADKLEDGLADVHDLIQHERPHPERRLRNALDELTNSCGRYMKLVQSKGPGSAGKTRLDKERMRMCMREMDQIGNMARNIKATVCKSSLKDKVKATATLLSRLRHIAPDPQHTLPDIFIWLTSNNRRIAYQRVMAKDLVYSVVEEEKGRECGRVQTLFLKLPGKKGQGPSGWAIQAKLHIYMWLGLCKHKKELLKGLPHGYEDTPLVRRSLRIVGTPPPAIKYTEKQVFQLRAHMYQARSLIGSDASGLSDPFARIVFGDQSLCTQVIDETLSPTWDEMLIFNEVIIYGTIDEIKQEPPVIVIEIFDQDRVGKAEFIGRALAKPVVKKSCERYEQPTFPPQLEWFDVCRGPDRAGELLAAFELLQYPFNEKELQRKLVSTPCTGKLAPPGDSSAQLELPPIELPSYEDTDRGPIMPVPKGIRPTLSRHRIEVLFWGMRELKRLQFTNVDKPRIDIECAGHVLSSSVIQNAKKNPNFTIPVKYFDVELPESEIFCPPITIRCVDCRNFGRYVLVGTHVINNIHKFMYVPTTKTSKEARKKYIGDKSPEVRTTQPSLLQIPPPTMGVPSLTVQKQPASVAADDVAILIDEKQPLITKPDPIITIDVGPQKKDQKTADTKKRKKKSGGSGDGDEDEMDAESLDWWSKYHASVETMIRRDPILSPWDLLKDIHRKIEADMSLPDPLDVDSKKMTENLSLASEQPSSPYGAIPNGNPGSTDDPDFDPKQAKKSEKELRKMETKKDGSSGGNTKPTLRGTAKAVALASKLSPKSQRKKDKVNSNVAQLKMYPNELEQQVEFNGFKEWLHTFELYRGKKTGDAEDDESRVVGKFKGSLKIYKIPLPPDIEDTTITGGDPQYGLFQGLPSNDPLHVLCRIYVVKANDLHPADINGKADPYVVIRLGKTSINDKDNYISKQLNPVFGKCFEVEATFPMDSLLTVQIYDWDLVGTDDLIGETAIDLENRFYSRHRATCGIASKYDLDGYNAWRDPMKPTQILAKLAKDNKVDGPYYQPGRVRIANRVFTAPMEMDDESGSMKAVCEEQLALAVLQNWEEIPKVGCKLVPEHVETRPLYHPEKPGIEQGKLEMMVDMFPMDMPPPGPQVDISPRKPKSYELRVIIWNTDDVVLEDDAFFTGEKMSDIYVKGWIKGPEDTQCTDIHYRSLTGEGNFNWRFIFPFDYLVAEEKIVISRKETLFSWDETETKIPARLNLQVWDADHFSADDFLGALTLDLNCFPRGAKSSKQCTLNMLKTDGSVPHMSIFKHKRVKGWWPFHVKNEGEEMELTGKVEAELHLLLADEAEKHPAGLGRNEPDPLDKPNRPDSSFIWFLNPLKSIRYILWHNYKWMIIKALVFALLSAILALFFYSMPGYTVKKIFHA